MVSLWHAFDLAASLGVAEVNSATTPERSASRARPIPPWIQTALLSAEEMRKHETAWRELAARALIPNLFFEPEFAYAAVTHLAPGHAPRFLLVFDERGAPASRLILAAPLLVPGYGVGEAKLWAPEPMLVSAPLLDRDHADLAIDTLFEAVRSGPARASGLLLPRIDEDGVFASLVSQSIQRSGRNILRFARPADAPARPAPPAHDRASVARGPRQVRDAVEQFLTIEALGPSGKNGEALLLSPPASALVRVVTRSLARRRHCRVMLYLAKGKPVGADIILRSGDTDLLWKRASAVELSAEAPTEAGESVRQTVDWLVAARPGSSPAMLALAARDHFGRRLRALVSRAASPPRKPDVSDLTSET